jgi:threonine/homoserine/homoserine lactone efflux protein
VDALLLGLSLGLGAGLAPGPLLVLFAVNALSPHPWLFWITAGGPLLVDAGDRSLAPAG